MATNIGIDFGSTYTTFSQYDPSEDKVSLIETQNMSYIPSFACMNRRGAILTGNDASRALTRDPNLSPFRAFKMLLQETSRNKPDLAVHLAPYEKENVTPEYITEKFLDKYLRKAADLELSHQFDNAVICVPELWADNYVQMSGRSVLLDICKGIVNAEGQPILKQIRVVTEPVAATAFYAYRYYKNHNNTPFDGKVIVVDYGGGTLDITLTSVKPRSRSGDPCLMEINAISRTGAGENHPNQIGDAGMAYMENVSRTALAEAGFANVPVDGDFLSVREDLENALMDNTDELRRLVFTEYGNYNLEDMLSNHNVFVTSSYADTDIPITYSMLYRVFMNSIHGVLTKHLGKIKEKLDECAKLDPVGFSEDKVRLAVVGGFGLFPLVEQTVLNFFGWTGPARDFTRDPRGTTKDKQRAVSHGAALIAANIITFKTVPKHSLGLWLTTNQGFKPVFAIHLGQEDFIPGKIYPVGNPWKPFMYQDWVFAFNGYKTSDTAIKLIPLPEVLQDLRDKVKDAKDLLKIKLATQGIDVEVTSYYVGFSMDESEIYTAYLFPAHPHTGARIKDVSIPLELGNFVKVFGPNRSLLPD